MRNEAGQPEMACGSKELDLPLSRFPLRGKAGAGGFPPRRRARCAASQNRWHASCAGSPHKRAAAPLCIPCDHGTQGLAICETTAKSEHARRPKSADAGESFTQKT